MSVSRPPDDTMPAWAAAARSGDWVAWPGLPAGVDEALVTRWLGATGEPERRPARLGHHLVDVVHRGGTSAWVRGGVVVLVEIEDPAGGHDVDALLARLGPPDRSGPGRHLRSGSTTTEHVWASRGLAVTVAESYDDPPTHAPFLAAVQLFTPTDLRAFVLELGGNDRGGPRL